MGSFLFRFVVCSFGGLEETRRPCESSASEPHLLRLAMRIGMTPPKSQPFFASSGFPVPSQSLLPLLAAGRRRNPRTPQAPDPSVRRSGWDPSVAARPSGRLQARSRRSSRSWRLSGHTNSFKTPKGLRQAKFQKGLSDPHAALKRQTPTDSKKV